MNEEADQNIKKRNPSICDETVNLITLGDDSKVAKALVLRYFG
jgi:hypothetical protein